MSRCCKISYTLAQAQAARTRCLRKRKKGDSKRKERRIYYCRTCRAYHLTSWRQSHER